MLLFLWLLQLPSALRGAIDHRAQRRTRPVRCSREVRVIVSSLVPPYLKGHKPSTQSPPTRTPEALSMSTREDGAPSPLVRSRDDLVGWIAAGAKPRNDWRIGT